jgi:hypothetical protein
MEPKDANAQSAPDMVETLEGYAHAELLQEFDNAAKVKLKASLERIAKAERVVANEKLRHEALKADLRAGRESPFAPEHDRATSVAKSKYRRGDDESDSF